MANAIPTLRTLDDFLETLAAQRGLHRKVRLLGHYWRQVRDLPADDRQRVALALGSESAWRHLEKFFGADGHLSEGELTVKRALRRVGRAEPDELRHLARRLRSGDYTEVGSELLVAMSQALEEESGIDTHPELEAPRSEPTPDPEPDAAAPAAGAPVPEAVSEAEPETGAGPEAEAEQEPEAAAPVEVQTEPEREQEMEAAAGPEVQSAPDPEPESGIQAAQKPDAIPRDRAEAASEDRRRDLHRLGGGWRARRLLGVWIREGKISNIEEALELAGVLDSDSQRSWFLGDLVQHWALEEAELAQVLAAAPSPRARQRLQDRHTRVHGAAARTEPRQ